MNDNHTALLSQIKRMATAYRQEYKTGLRQPFHIRKGDPIGRDIARAVTQQCGIPFVHAQGIRDEKKLMLACKTLAAVYSAAAACHGPIIEIGAYVGGATLALLEATRKKGNTVISIEFGVSYELPVIPVADRL